METKKRENICFRLIQTACCVFLCGFIIVFALSCNSKDDVNPENSIENADTDTNNGNQVAAVEDHFFGSVGEIPDSGLVDIQIIKHFR